MTEDSPLFKLPQQRQLCPLCQNALQIKSSKNGPFLGCSAYPGCNYIKPLHQHDHAIVKVLPTEICPQCGSELAVKNGRYGMFIGCTGYPACDFVVDQHEDNTDQPQLSCPKCKKGQLTERINKFGKHFYGCDRYPDCRFLINDKPQQGNCYYCGFPLLVAKKDALFCAKKGCGKKQPAPEAGTTD
ncbi:putative DNA topoisomerase [Arsukibacterium tuosuense]|uniref:Putative DNA topoisomerase n=1 Tax=Arsukibacterium tuosuense TaxID=1323745 RepID=A0A285ILC9_9GAMM|nr:topoisomerase DNA-binding C4 zinc finger domain-containing protein [Arsukibacterium tuosuense]SNY48820.1 putative DNA topoisomerase [Arsukibacterium tuosuense]